MYFTSGRREYIFNVCWLDSNTGRKIHSIKGHRVYFTEARSTWEYHSQLSVTELEIANYPGAQGGSSTPRLSLIIAPAAAPRCIVRFICKTR